MANFCKLTKIIFTNKGDTNQEKDISRLKNYFKKSQFEYKKYNIRILSKKTQFELRVVTVE